ncbi:MAG: orotate phosphoribosyltransferase [Bacillota bacterium]|nr:orotate phosphoribosyltransferase [Bacillota bacterium]
MDTTSSLIQIVEALFATAALRVAPADEPFWYTSGLFGPYYINTHFLYGSQEAAEQLLGVMDRELADESTAGQEALIAELQRETERQEAGTPVYRAVIDALVEVAAGLGAAAISGGARRDFFFSLPVARRLGLPHLAIFKGGGSCWSAAADVVSGGRFDGLAAGSRIVHVADLVTEASSYTRDWLPALRRLGLEIRDTVAVVDRVQGGAAVLEAEGVRLHALVRFDRELFVAAARAGHITAGQLEQILAYGADPRGYVRTFLRRHPNFLETMAARDTRTRERVERLRAMQL